MPSLSLALERDAKPVVVTPTTPEERSLLHDAGFVHVTGLRLTNWRLVDCEEPAPIGKDLAPIDLGRYGYNAGFQVIVTLGGEVWIRHTSPEDDGRPDVLRRFCPNGGDAWVPCGNGVGIDFYDLMARFADPDYQPR